METKHDSLGFVRVISRPACTRTRTQYTCDWWSSRSPRFNFTGIHRRNDFVSCCAGVLIDFSIIDNATLPTRRSLIAQPLWWYIYIYTWSKFRLWSVQWIEIRMCKGGWSNVFWSSGLVRIRETLRSEWISESKLNYFMLFILFDLSWYRKDSAIKDRLVEWSRICIHYFRISRYLVQVSVEEQEFSKDRISK